MTALHSALCTLHSALCTALSPHFAFFPASLLFPIPCTLIYGFFAIIIGSSLIVVSNQGPRGIFGLPLLGITGYIIATVLGIWLLISIIRSGRL